jgi:hypothetical protein
MFVFAGPHFQDLARKIPTLGAKFVFSFIYAAFQDITLGRPVVFITRGATPCAPDLLRINLSLCPITEFLFGPKTYRTAVAVHTTRR